MRDPFSSLSVLFSARSRSCFVRCFRPVAFLFPRLVSCCFDFFLMQPAKTKRNPYLFLAFAGCTSMWSPKTNLQQPSSPLTPFSRLKYNRNLLNYFGDVLQPLVFQRQQRTQRMLQRTKSRGVLASHLSLLFVVYLSVPAQPGWTPYLLAPHHTPGLVFAWAPHKSE